MKGLLFSRVPPNFFGPSYFEAALVGESFITAEAEIYSCQGQVKNCITLVERVCL